MSADETTTNNGASGPDAPASGTGWDALRAALGELNHMRQLATSPLKLFGYLRQTMTERPLVALAAAVVVGAMLRKRLMRH